MKNKYQSSLLILSAASALALCVPSLGLAASTPSPVSGVKASLQGGKLVTSWNAATDSVAIAYYRVYVSSKSILNNGGDYDDFRKTSTNDTSYTFASLPLASEKIYVSVLAVNADGAESAGFQSEAIVAIPSSSSSSSTSSSTSVTTTPISQPAIEPLVMRSAIATSPTNVNVSFNKDVLPAAEILYGIFHITRNETTTLPILTLKVAGSVMHITTAPQIPGQSYTMTITGAIPAEDGAKSATGTTISFIGFTAPDQQTYEMPTPEPKTIINTNKLPQTGLPLVGITAVSGYFASRSLKKKKK